jgi:diguanylate cyclase (GGDEF)-like protein
MTSVSGVERFRWISAQRAAWAVPTLRVEPRCGIGVRCARLRIRLGGVGRAAAARTRGKDSQVPWNRQGRGQEADQLASDADQTASDADQTSSDIDQSASDRDQAQSEADQRASDRDQAVADREYKGRHVVDTALRLAYVRSRSQRDEGTLDREATRVVRAQIADDRDLQATLRDQNARQRDLTAEGRDREAEEREHDAEALARELSDTDPRAALEAAVTARAHAAAARGQASADREQAARDRLAAARDRERFQDQLERTHLDELTGAYRRGMGEIVMRHEIERARRSNGDLVLAYVDVDGLKATNDRKGHAAGDDLLRDVVAALRSRLRPYDPLTRWGGDEFVCAVSSTSVKEAGQRFEEAREVLAAEKPGARFSFGLAALANDDTLEALLDRADRSLLRARGGE